MARYEYSKEDEEFIKKNAGVLKDEQIAAMLGKTVAGVRKYRQRLGLKKKRGRGYSVLDGPSLF